MRGQGLEPVVSSHYLSRGDSFSAKRGLLLPPPLTLPRCAREGAIAARSPSEKLLMGRKTSFTLASSLRTRHYADQRLDTPLPDMSWGVTLRLIGSPRRRAAESTRES